MSKMIGKSRKIKYLLSMIVISILITFFGMFKIEAYFQKNISTNVAFTTKSFTNLTLSFNKAQYSTTEGMILTVSNPNPYNVSYHISLANSNLTYLVDNTTPTQYEVTANSSRVHTILINNPPVGNLSITLNADFSYSTQISTNIEIVNSATFIPGPDFYERLGSDTGGGGGVMKYNPNNHYQVINLVNIIDKKIKPIKTSLVELKSNIHSIVRASSLPNDYEEWFTNENIVSTSDSDTPIYAWFDYETLYYYSSASILYLNPDSSMMFANLRLEEFDISDLNTSKVTNMSEMFKDFSGLSSGGGFLKHKYSNRANLIPLNSVLEYDNDRGKYNLNLSNFDTSKVTNMSSMFENASLGGINLSSFDTSKVTDMTHMFYNCTSLANLNLSNFNTSNVTNMNNMFYGCSRLTTLNLSNFNTSKVTDMSYMFDGCSSLTTLNLSNFDTSKVTDMSYMFAGCNGLATLNLSSFDTSNVMHMSYMFYECMSLTTLNLSSFNTSKVTDMDAMFYSCSKLISLDISKFDISSVTSAYDMLYDMMSLTTLITPKVNSSIQITLSSTMRDSSYNLYTKLTPSTPTRTTLTIVQTFITGSNFNAKLKKLSGQSSATYSTQNTTITSIVRVSSLPNGMSINNFTYNNIISINGTINPIYAWYDNGTIYYYSEEETLFLNSYSSYMFYNMQGLTSIDFTNVDSSIVTNMNSMFRYCKSLTSLDLSNFDMSNVTNTSSMLSSSSPVTIVTPKLIRSGKTIYLSAQMQDNLGNVYTNLTSTTPTQTTLTAMTIFNNGTEVNVKLKKLSGQSDATYSTSNTTITSIVRSNTLSITPTSDNIISASNSPIPIYAWYDNGVIYYYSASTTLYLNELAHNMFNRMENVTSIDLTNIDSSRVTNMSEMFNGCRSLRNLNLSNFNTSNVTNMSSMFSGCSSLTSINLSSFNTSNVTNMSSMFSGCSSLTSINLSSFNTSNVTNMSSMFSGCSSISSLNLSSFDVSLITYPSGMLSNMTSLSTLVTPKVMMTSEHTITLPKIMSDNSDNIYDTLNKNTLTRTTLTPVTVFAQGGIINSKFKKLSGQSDPNTTTENTTITSIVRSSTLAINPTDDNLISHDYSLAPIYAWYSNGTIYYYSATTKIYFDQNSSRMFANMKGLTNVSFTNVSFAYVNDASFMFSNCISLTSLDLSNSNFKNATKFNSMFEECRNLANLNLSGLNTAKLTDISSMFYYTGYNSGTFSLDVSNWNTSNVTNMNSMFYDTGYNATSFTITGLSSWNTSNVTDMSSMFVSAGRNATIWNIGNLSNWDVSNVKYMSSMFSSAGYNATSFNLNLSNWNTSNVTDMSSMFVSAGRNATTWNIGNLSNWNVSKVTNMTSMFWYAGYSAATWNIGNLSNWDVSNVTNMNDMFSNAGYNATSFNLNLSNWNTSSVTSMADMFAYSGYSATTWNIGNLSNWNTSNVTNMNYMFYAAGYSATTWNSIGTLKVYTTYISSIFNNSPKANGTINIYSNPTNYSLAFRGAATSGPGIVVNYSSATTNIDAIIATKSSNSNVTKGSQLD